MIRVWMALGLPLVRIIILFDYLVAGALIVPLHLRTYGCKDITIRFLLLHRELDKEFARTVKLFVPISFINMKNSLFTRDPKTYCETQNVSFV